MSIRRFLQVISIVMPVALSGCVAQPNDSRLDGMVTSTQFDSRFDALETTLSQRCSLQTERWQTHETHFGNLGDELSDEMRNVGRVLRGLRADVERLDTEPNLVISDCSATQNPLLENKQLLGRNEWVGFPTIGTYLKARIDSGANTASLSATDITEFERDGEDWLRFKLALDDDAAVIDDVRGEWIEAEVTRRVRIIQASGSESRPVITLLMELGPIKQNVEFTLNDRTHLTYPVLLGRRFMMDIALIDVAKAYLHERPEYPGGEPSELAAEDEAADLVDDDEDE